MGELVEKGDSSRECGCSMDPAEGLAKAVATDMQALLSSRP